MTDTATLTQIDSDYQRFLAGMAAAGTPVCADCCHNLVDGACPNCTFNAQTPLVYANAHGRMEEGVGDDAQRKADERIVRLYERIEEQVRRDATTAPNGCRWCGIDNEGLNHGSRYHGKQLGVGLWEPPTDAQRLGRMLARRHSGWNAWKEINRRFYAALDAEGIAR
jgi:hypothetical protein